MTDQTSYPLHTVFENLLKNGTQDFINSPAVWHVPDPLLLYQSTAAESNGTAVNPDPSNAVRTISFSELNLLSNQMAVTLSIKIRQSVFARTTRRVNGIASLEQPQPVQSDTIVALFMPPGIDRIVAQVACMKLHLAYLPLDRQLSIGRILQILEMIPPVMVIVARDYHKRMFNEVTLVNDQQSPSRKQAEAFFTGKVKTLREAFQTISTVVWEDLLDGTREHQLCANCVTNSPGVQINGHTEFGIARSVCLFPDISNPVVIVLFTSGSSTAGQKVVRLRQSQLFNRLQWQWSTGVEWDSEKQWTYHATPHNRDRDEVSLASTACVFVDAFTEMFSALFNGIPIVVPGGSVCASEACVSDVRILAKLVEVFAITRITTVPVQLSIWINQVRLISCTKRAREFRSLRTVVVSGDILLPQLAHEFFQFFANHPIRLLNFYGTTELAGDVTAAVFHGERDVTEATRHVDANDQAESLLEGAPFVAVGKPISNTNIYIVRRRINGEENREFGQRHDSGSLTMVVSENADPVNIQNLSILGKGDGDQIDWEAEGYGICEKGCIGEIAVTGLAVFDNSVKLLDLNKKQNSSVTEVGAENGSHCDQDNPPCINFPGDLGFVCPKDGLLYVCGRSDELVKINAVGFFAGDVDRLIDRMKQTCVQNPHQMSTVELKLPRILQTVTIPIRHPINKNKQLVCFYTTGEPTNQPLASFGIPRDLRQMDTSTEQDETNAANFGPLPIELSAIIANYLPVYIRPIFVHVNHIPVMPTSGKIDKQGLRAFYENSIITVARSARACCSLPHCLSSNTQSNQTSQSNPFSTAMDNEAVYVERIEQARMVLANVLGLDYMSNPGEKGRPRDDEDFYILGGNSLSAVLALESLRQLGFKVYLETFYRTGNIGQILQSLWSHMENASQGVTKMDSLSKSNSRCISFIEKQSTIPETSGLCRTPAPKDEAVLVREWDYKPSNQTDSSLHSFDEIVNLLVNAFDRNDQVARAFGLSQMDLKLAASIYLDVRRQGHGIVLTASFESDPPEGSSVNKSTHREQLVGTLISLPMQSVPELPRDHKLHILQRYFDFCSALHLSQLDPAKTLTVVMAGMVPPITDGCKNEIQSTKAKWKRITLEILVNMETELLKLAQERNYTHVETLNTCETTMEVCFELGYTVFKTTRMQQFVEAEQIASDPTYNEHYCYHMIKALGE